MISCGGAHWSTVNESQVRKTNFSQTSTDARPGAHVPSDGSCKLSKEPEVVVIEEADVIDSVSQHRKPLKTATKCPPGIHGWIDPHIGKHLGMHHARAAEFDPAGALAHPATTAIADMTGHIHLSARFDKRKVPASKPDFAVWAEQCAGNRRQCSAQIGHSHIPVNAEALHLREHGLM